MHYSLLSTHYAGLQHDALLGAVLAQRRLLVERVALDLVDAGRPHDRRPLQRLKVRHREVGDANRARLLTQIKSLFMSVERSPRMDYGAGDGMPSYSGSKAARLALAQRVLHCTPGLGAQRGHLLPAVPWLGLRS